MSNNRRRREPLSAILAGQPLSAQVAATRGTVYGSEGWGFESLRARPGQRPIAILQKPLLLPKLLPKRPSSCLEQLIDRVRGFLAKPGQHVRVGVHRHADPGVPEHFHDRP
jgi:hypothetical protein